MAQSAMEQAKGLLPVTYFLQNHTTEPPSPWITWKRQFQNALTAKEGIKFEDFNREEPVGVLPPEPMGETAIAGETPEHQLERNLRNNQRRTDWTNECARIQFRGLQIRGHPWKEVQAQVEAMLYASLGKEGQRRYTQVHEDITSPGLLVLWTRLEEMFTKEPNVTFERFQFAKRKQKLGESMEQYYGVLRELSVHCSFGGVRDTLVRDQFIQNISIRRYKRSY